MHGLVSTISPAHGHDRAASPAEATGVTRKPPGRTAGPGARGIISAEAMGAPGRVYGGSWCIALTWPPKPSRADRGVRRPRRTRPPRCPLSPVTGRSPAPPSPRRWSPCWRADRPPPWARRPGHLGRLVWGRAQRAGYVAGAAGGTVARPCGRGTSQFPARAHCRAGVTVSGGQSAASQGALPDGVRLLRLAGVRCCAGVAALVLGIGWAVRADAGRSVPAWGFTGGHCAALGARTAPA